MEGVMRVKSMLAAALCAAAVAAVGAGSAFAGEITKNGKPTPISQYTAASICSFSGLNDEFVEGDTAAPQTQSWGQLVRENTPVHGGAGVPGTACNPNLGGEE
jgi:hypothetical protein